jgi:hypothetical protein
VATNQSGRGICLGSGSLSGVVATLLISKANSCAAASLMLSVGAVMPTRAHAGAVNMAFAKATVSVPVEGDGKGDANLSIVGILEHMQNDSARAYP